MFLKKIRFNKIFFHRKEATMYMGAMLQMVKNLEMREESRTESRTAQNIY